ncbi:hypothetical protein BX616_002636 [Lobosporangium transversale]|uniref:Uncharacterized protein n=1 Tax=Lobosporangium transversale TaxID=64571 RepID=A0A1Y2GAP4_9FUNG|nr:hypothetical protein BCR41DRAFT_374929 [Lobosporangium transversale]KAF9916847.1 hypothetical protein BX616_002636 [Lobosporangium transversale]ORZ04436.1 hypothetical protein BCR41DRAFT_374929 [Lobosporangium transversale]|eukprot:XP_021876544.1 hypothetical protein BCR41DRAFT_374929 [Lobosporangium transversale]
MTATALPFLLLSLATNCTLLQVISKPIASFGFVTASLAYLPPAAPSTAPTLLTNAAFSNFTEFLRNVPVLGIFGLLLDQIRQLLHLYTHVAPTVFFRSTYSKVLVAGSVCGFLGDVFLMFDWGFLPGVACFACGITAAMVAFVLHGQNGYAAKKGMMFALVVDMFFIPWLFPKITSKVMKIAQARKTHVNSEAKALIATRNPTKNTE